MAGFNEQSDVLVQQVGRAGAGGTADVDIFHKISLAALVCHRERERER
jgi:hypothetical protein